jgi:hypothetical protein
MNTTVFVFVLIQADMGMHNINITLRHEVFAISIISLLPLKKGMDNSSRL